MMRASSLPDGTTAVDASVSEKPPISNSPPIQTTKAAGGPAVSEFDLSVIEALRREVGEEVLKTLLGSLFAEIHVSARRAGEQHAAKAWAELQVNAHSIKSVASSFGAVVLAHESKRLEAAATEGRVDDSQLADFSQCCARVLKELEDSILPHL